MAQGLGQRGLKYSLIRPRADLLRAGRKRCEKDGDTDGAAWQRHFELRAVGQELIDAGGVQQGYWHLVAAEILRPKPKPWPELAPAPRPAR